MLAVSLASSSSFAQGLSDNLMAKSNTVEHTLKAYFVQTAPLFQLDFQIHPINTLWLKSHNHIKIKKCHFPGKAIATLKYQLL